MGFGFGSRPAVFFRFIFLGSSLSAMRFSPADIEAAAGAAEEVGSSKSAILGEKQA